MTDAMRVSSPITGTDKTLTFETGKLAQLADGAVTAHPDGPDVVEMKRRRQVELGLRGNRQQKEKDRLKQFHRHDPERATPSR